MITIEQCRGARGLLGWTQQDLADASGLSKTAINNFEKGHSDIKAESLRAIRLAVESADVEFLGSAGISKKTESFKIIRGDCALPQLIEDIKQTLAGKQGEILISFVDQTLANRLTTQKLFKYIDFLKQNDIKQRVLSFSGSQHILSPDEECRWIDEKFINVGTTTFIYGDKVAMELWDKSAIIITRSTEAVNAERGRFEQLWQNAIAPNESAQIPQDQQAQKSGA